MEQLTEPNNEQQRRVVEEALGPLLGGNLVIFNSSI